MKTTEPNEAVAEKKPRKSTYRTKKQAAPVAEKQLVVNKGSVTKLITALQPGAGLKEQVKAGVTTAKQALETLAAKGKHAKASRTYEWLQRRFVKESYKANSKA